MYNPVKLFKEYLNIRKELKKQQELFLSNFKLESDEEYTTAELTFQHEEFIRWLAMIHGFIQKCLDKQPLIKNYLVCEMQIGKQKVEFSFIKDFKDSPHQIRMRLEEENKILKKRIEELENDIGVCRG